MCSDTPAWKELISHPLTMDKRISMIAAIFSDRNQAKMVERLDGDDAQIFIDVVDEVSLHIIFLSEEQVG